MASTTLDSYQQVFALSMLSNRAASYSGSATNLQQQLQYELAPFLTNVPVISGVTWPTAAQSAAGAAAIGNWQLEWGPAVFRSGDKDEIQVADNAMFVASSTGFTRPDGTTGPVYVVAIAATNPISLYDWEVEDGDVHPRVDFNVFTSTPVPNPTPATALYILWHLQAPYISAGTAIGVTNLLSLVSPTGAAAPGTTLLDFLSTVKTASGPKPALIFTGHSLAGALSPTLAYYLTASAPNNPTAQTAVSNFSQVAAYPTAGATPGNSVFSGNFNSAFRQTPAGSLPYQQWNTNHWNYYDVVPHAWSTTSAANLTQVPTLYGGCPGDIKTAINLAIDNASGIQPLAYDALPNAPLNQANPATVQAGTSMIVPKNQPVGGPTLTGIPLSVPPATDEDFLLQLAVQHVGMYSGIPSFTYQPNTPGGTPITTPDIPGLILPAPLPKFPLGVVPGLTVLTEAQIITDFKAWLKSLLPHV